MLVAPNLHSTTLSRNNIARMTMDTLVPIIKRVEVSWLVPIASSSATSMTPTITRLDEKFGLTGIFIFCHHWNLIRRPKNLKNSFIETHLTQLKWNYFLFLDDFCHFRNSLKTHFDLGFLSRRLSYCWFKCHYRAYSSVQSGNSLKIHQNRQSRWVPV